MKMAQEVAGHWDREAGMVKMTNQLLKFLV
jgi:hypothetical protein